MRLLKPILWLLFLFAGTHSLRAQGQGIDPSTPPPPPPPDTPAPKTPAAPPIDPGVPPPPPPSETEAAAAPSAPVFDPYHAQKSIDVGTFYMKQGKYDAAIDRFEEAAHYQPSLALPWRLLGEAYEKKRDYPKAIETYKKYLEVFPRAGDADKITKQIAALEEKVAKESSKEPAR
ncbi:MAG: tetratricopeptide repeat protein [Candidatus Acidiferrales bacterium]